jgi:hypothetical protein
VRLFAFPVRTASPSKARDDILFSGEGCDNVGVTVAATLFK